jgi:hypothetical protein
VERTIACEAMQEHLWRLMLDWPKLLGLPMQEQRFTAWYSMLRKIGAGEIDMSAFQNEFERDGLGVQLAEWRALDNYHVLQAWFSKVHSPMAQLLFKLDELKRDGVAQNSGRLLPAWSAAEAQQACSGMWKTDFSARPEWFGDTAETGAWSYFAESKLLRDVWQQSGSKVLVRLLARIMDVVEIASGCAAPRLDASSPAAGEGISVVRTARGLLMHHVQLTAEKVREYEIVAPTEWNFHPDGAFAQDMRGLVEMDARRLQQMAKIEVLSLDPCVAYEVEMRDA